MSRTNRGELKGSEKKKGGKVTVRGRGRLQVKEGQGKRGKYYEKCVLSELPFL